MSSSESIPHDENQFSPPTDQEIWRSILALTSKGLEQVDQEMQKRSGITLTDYEILLALSGADDVRLRMSELAEKVFVSRSRLTYRVDRLTEVGFVVREECQDDRRGLWAILTETGSERLDSATKGHEADLQTLIFDHVGVDERASLAASLARIANKLNGD